MPDSHREENLAVRAFPVVTSILIPLSTILVFLILPLLGKQLVPAFGGGANIWIGCVTILFAAFLLGHGWAAWLLGKPRATQLLAISLLGLIAVVVFRLPSAEASTAGFAGVIWRLAFTALPALVLLFGIGPIVGGWLQQRGMHPPYYIHVVTGLGSLAVLLLYPFLFETGFFLSELSFYWHCCLVIAVGLFAGTGYLVWKTVAEHRAAGKPTDCPPALLLLQLGISALTWIGLLGATAHLTDEIGAGPLAWVAPLSIYLLSYLITFSGRWCRWMTLVSLVWLAVSLTGFAAIKGFTAVTVNSLGAWWLFSLTASGCFLANALLQDLGRTQGRTQLNVRIAAGALLGALATALVVPGLLHRLAEFQLASAGLLIIGLLWLTARRDLATVAVVSAVVVAPLLGLALVQATHEGGADSRMIHLRDLTGQLLVKTDARSVVLSAGTTTRASQLTIDEAARHRPTLYYTESSGVGRVIEKLSNARPKLSVGIVGLGAGTLAAYARGADTYEFWDSDAKAQRVSRENFTFVAESPGTIKLTLRDGRGALDESKQDFDLLVLDATTAAGIPAYFLTKEAITTYEHRLAKLDGLLVIHASSRYAKLFPVVEATARMLGLAAIGVTTDITGSTLTRDWDPTRTDYIIVCRPELVAAISSWFPAEEDNGRVKHRLTTVQAPLFNQQLIWRDDRNATLDNFELGRFLFEP